MQTEAQTDRRMTEQLDRHADRSTDRHADRSTDRQTDRQTDRDTDIGCFDGYRPYNTIFVNIVFSGK